MECDTEVWKNINPDDAWIFDKLILAKKLGYTCGPKGVDVPTSNYYMVKPCINVLGMGIGANKVYIDRGTEHLPSGYFWSEYFKGRHLSVDYYKGTQALCIEGIKKPNSFQEFDIWKKVNDNIPYPDILKELKGNYDWINIEFIDSKIIEVHLRRNPDFIGHTSDYTKPVWGDREMAPDEEFLSRPDDGRKGFYIQKGTVIK